MRLVKLPTIRSKHLDTMVHSLLSAVHALAQGYDVALFFNVGTQRGDVDPAPGRPAGAMAHPRATSPTGRKP